MISLYIYESHLFLFKWFHSNKYRASIEIGKYEILSKTKKTPTLPVIGLLVRCTEKSYIFAKPKNHD